MGVVLMKRRRRTRANHPRQRRQPQRGMSLIEATIAAAILLFIAAGILPLFAQALANNLSGADSTSVSNSARSGTEELFQLPFNSARLTLVSGTELVVEDYYSLAEKKWKPGPEPSGGSDPALWNRTATVRQYSVNALEDGLLEPSEALEFDAHVSQVHLKEIELEVVGTRTAGPLGPSRRIATRTMKSQ